MQNARMQSTKRIRSTNWEPMEKELLRDLAKQYVAVIENKNTDTNTNVKRKKAWLEIHQRFNGLNCQTRQLNHIQQQWRTMKLEAKKGISSYKQSLKKTGGGEKPPSPKLEHYEMLNLLPLEFEEDDNIFDSNGGNVNGEKLMDVSNLDVPEIEERLKALNQAWAELKGLANTRGQKLDQSSTYQQFLAKVEEEEAWISEKQQLLSVEDYGDTMAAVQGLLKKHDAFETELAAHRDRCSDICGANTRGQKLDQSNTYQQYHAKVEETTK